MNKDYKEIKTGVVRSIPESLYNKYKDSIYAGLRPLDIEESKPIVIDPIKKGDPVVEVEDPEEAIEDIEVLRDEYFAKTGKQVSNKFKNDAEWIKSKIDGL